MSLVNEKIIPVFKPFHNEQEVDAVKQVIESGWIGLGPKVKEFEDTFSTYIDVPYCVGLNSGTAALDMAMKLLGIKEGDEVIVPTITFVSTAHAVVYNKATPIFADCDSVTLNICLEDLARKITPRTKAVIVVHYGGRPVDLDKVKEIVGDIPIVEDCAHAAGAYYKGKHVGTANIGCFSFHAVKNLAMGEGGAITLNDQGMMKRAKQLRWLGIDKGTWDRVDGDRSYWWEYNVGEIGLKSHLNDIHAAIGLVQLNKLDYGNTIREMFVEYYREELGDLLEFPLPSDADYNSSWHLCSVKAVERDNLSVFLKDRGICTGVHFKPIHLYECYGKQDRLPKSEEQFKKIITLPLYPGLLEADLKRIVIEIRSFYNIN